MTILFADLVDSTVLPTRVELETCRALVGRYREGVNVDEHALDGLYRIAEAKLLAAQMATGGAPTSVADAG